MLQPTDIKIGNKEYDVRPLNKDLLVNGVTMPRPDFHMEDRLIRARVDGRIEEFVVTRIGDDLWLQYPGREYPLKIMTERMRLLKLAEANTDGGQHGAVIRAAMPGLVVRILVGVEQEVKRNDPVLILEAMKMENELRAPADGVVKEIRTSEKSSVEKGDVLIVLS
ncbi:acetyl-CoA carboxylase biotin carboxyl carrier protein subunit [bacterium]|nr:acetyl-CoA carboxylase biotin carboxyl carrier protein subunit [bacterium]